MSAISDEKYVRLTTFTKDGGRKESPVWIAELGEGTVGFTTGLDSWKVKRIGNTATIELSPSDMKGRVKDGSSTVTGTATVVTGPDFESVQAAIRAKYGFQVLTMKAVSRIGKLFGRGDSSNCGVVITLE